MKLLFFIYIFLIPSKISMHSWMNTTGHHFIVWNIGQGSWSTAVEPQYCIHFDLGGEFHPSFEKLMNYCGGKTQVIVLSHYDNDHTNFLFWFYKMVMTDLSKRAQLNEILFCAMDYPSLADKAKIHFYKKLITTIPKCNIKFKDHRLDNPLQLIYSPSPQQSSNKQFIHSVQLNRSTQKNRISNNELSRVAQWKDIVIPGDSTRKDENIWINNIKKEVNILILGHHGSRTSTSEKLLNHLPHIQMAVASSRQTVYGHPHKEIIQRLKKYHIPLLRTEIWGNIIFEYKNNNY